jgi:hypothetical protein
MGTLRGLPIGRALPVDEAAGPHTGASNRDHGSTETHGHSGRTAPADSGIVYDGRTFIPQVWLTPRGAIYTVGAFSCLSRTLRRSIGPAGRHEAVRISRSPTRLRHDVVNGRR